MRRTKMIINLITILLLFASCQKSNNVPEVYKGAWETFSLEDETNHLLYFRNNGSASYSYFGIGELNNEPIDGRVKIKNDELSIGMFDPKKFAIIHPPTLNDLGVYQMQLNELLFFRD